MWWPRRRFDLLDFILFFFNLSFIIVFDAPLIPLSLLRVLLLCVLRMAEKIEANKGSRNVKNFLKFAYQIKDHILLFAFYVPQDVP